MSREMQNSGMLEQFCSIDEKNIVDDVASIYKRKVTEVLKNPDILEMNLLSAQNETCPICNKLLITLLLHLLIQNR